MKKSTYLREQITQQETILTRNMILTHIAIGAIELEKWGEIKKTATAKIMLCQDQDVTAAEIWRVPYNRTQIPRLAGTVAG